MTRRRQHLCAYALITLGLLVAILGGLSVAYWYIWAEPNHFRREVADTAELNAAAGGVLLAIGVLWQTFP